MAYMVTAKSGTSGWPICLRVLNVTELIKERDRLLGQNCTDLEYWCSMSKNITLEELLKQRKE